LSPVRAQSTGGREFRPSVPIFRRGLRVR